MSGGVKTGWFYVEGGFWSSSWGLGVVRTPNVGRYRGDRVPDSDATLRFVTVMAAS